MPMHLTQELKRAIQNDPSKCVLWVGAGLSASGVRNKRRGLPDWNNLVRHMIENLRDSEKCNASMLLKLEEYIKKSEHLEIARVFKQLTRPDQFSAFIRSELDPPDITESRIHEVILKANFRGIITTNFDMVFEYQSNRLQPLVYPQCLDDIDSFRRHGFFAKIHGCIRNTPNLAENLVLTKKSYATLRSNQKYHTILRSLLVMHPILTVGFSLRDPDFIGLIDDLKEIFGDGMPTVYSLMFKASQKAREEWRTTGVEIISYKNHEELLPFFIDILNLTERKHPLPKIRSVHQESEIDYAALQERWNRAQKIEETNKIVYDQIAQLPNDEERESFLFRFFALIDNRDRIRLTPHLLDLGTPQVERVLFSIFKEAGKENRWKALTPHPKHIRIHKWVLGNWPDLAYEQTNLLFAWLLDKDWIEHGIDLWETFLSLLNRLVNSEHVSDLMGLYDVCQHIEGAPERIEKIVFAPNFVREDDPESRWFKSWYQRVLNYVRYEKFKKSIQSETTLSYKDQLAEATKIEVLLPNDSYRQCTEYVVNNFLREYVQRSHLTLHSSSDLYDPGKSQEILDALAKLKDKQQQLTVLWQINRWPERMRGLLSLGEDTKSLRNGLFVPLWWRYSTKTRIEYLQEHHKHRMHELLWTTGQEYLLENMMGFTYDIDTDIKNAFNASLNQHLAPEGYHKYEPRPLQEIWRGRELNYELNDDVSPELVRRIAVKRVDWDNLQPGEVRWKEALEQARSLENSKLSDFVSKEESNYVIDNLLGAYFPAKTKIVLYTRMIEKAAKDLGVDKDALSTVIYIHETVHAYSHIGKDYDGRTWSDFSLPLSDQPDFYPSLPHESIAQYYTFKLLQKLNDEKLKHAFLILEQYCTDVYRAWRATENYTLEEMRNILVKYRERLVEWPPSF